MKISDIGTLIRLTACEEGGFTATIDNCPGCISEGDSIADTLRNLAEAYELWIEEIVADWE